MYGMTREDRIDIKDDKRREEKIIISNMRMIGVYEREVEYRVLGGSRTKVADPILLGRRRNIIIVRSKFGTQQESKGVFYGDDKATGRLPPLDFIYYLFLYGTVRINSKNKIYKNMYYTYYFVKYFLNTYYNSIRYKILY